MKRIQRAAGAVVGSAVGDALGAPFEFGPQRAFSARFPAPGASGEMCGGGGWDPGEATDDTQMAVLVAESLLERGGLDLPDIFARFQRWAASEPKDIGLQTEDVLTNGMPWDLAAAIHTGGLGGAYYGLDAIPVRWTQPLHVPLPGFDGRVLHLRDLLRLAHRLAEEPR
ncbi:ADP-ribosylglycohydrolase family protein [Streptomyces sp. NPDC005930]|uniref:ADP-ribosylglycohydrolase family protein n=1 Tax=Streptomyces sp. NPDC005930 TaxID=3364736 RepID=UPI003693D35A